MTIVIRTSGRLARGLPEAAIPRRRRPRYRSIIVL
jgi:hypothetical protein